MSYHIVDISSNGAQLSVRDRQLVCRTEDGLTRSLPMEDIGSVVVNSFSVTMHNSFLSAAGEAKIPIVICDKFRPKSVVLPVQRGGDTLITRAQISASPKYLESLWVKTINAKVGNQLSLAEKLEPDHPRLVDLRVAVRRTDAAREGNCARLYWDVISKAIHQPEFRRQPKGDGANALFNYSYGVLLTRVLQRLLAIGLDPMYGVGHMVRERAVPLAYDVMEPFRPAFDEAVVGWMRKGAAPDGWVVNREFKSVAQGVMKVRYPYLRLKSVALEDIVDLVVKSLKTAFLTGKITEYRPWIWRSSVWDG